VPEVTFAVAHGQMPPSALDDIMTQFYDGASMCCSRPPSSNPASIFRAPTR
jgi:hypothetical protein